jgi:hypothetical protein
LLVLLLLLYTHQLRAMQLLCPSLLQQLRHLLLLLMQQLALHAAACLKWLLRCVGACWCRHCPRSSSSPDRSDILLLLMLQL